MVSYAFIIAVSVINPAKLKAKFRGFKTDQDEIKILPITATLISFAFVCLLWRSEARGSNSENSCPTLSIEKMVSMSKAKLHFFQETIFLITKNLPLGTKKYPYRAAPPRMAHYSKYPLGGGENSAILEVTRAVTFGILLYVSILQATTRCRHMPE